MGRPIKKSMFGDVANPGKQLRVTNAWISGAPAASTNPVWVVKQINPRRFIVSDGVTVGEVILQAGAITAAGQARIAVSVFGGGTEYARNIQSKKVKTFEGNVYFWNRDLAADQAGEADLPFV